MRQYRRALVTGATSGIGAAFAAELPPTTDLMLTGRNQDRLDAAKAGLTRPGRVVETVAADLREESQVRRLIEQAEAFGIDLLINNAGIGRVGRILEMPLEAERDTVAVNVMAVVLLTRGLLPGMLRRARAGKARAGLVTVSSTAAFAPVPFFATYAASKAFDLLYTEGMAEELRHEPVDVLALCPGATRTAFGDRAGLIGRGVPFARDPHKVAGDALRALGRQSVFITGSISQATLGPWLGPRRWVTGALGMAMRFVNQRMVDGAA